LKGSNDISGQEMKKDAAPPPSSGARNQRSSPVDGFALTGVSNPPDPTTHAYRQDLADTALAHLVIASHYADPFVRHMVAAAPFLPEPGKDDAPIAELSEGDEIRVLDISRGWAWGYGPNGLVGYVRAEAVGA
jgi:hypothetical protein